MIENKLIGNVIIDPDAKTITPDLMVRTVFGMSLDGFVRDIIENRNGKYDCLFN